jgi:hypothetical protein
MYNGFNFLQVRHVNIMICTILNEKYTTKNHCHTMNKLLSWYHEVCYYLATTRVSYGTIYKTLIITICRYTSSFSSATTSSHLAQLAEGTNVLIQASMTEEGAIVKKLTLQ